MNKKLGNMKPWPQVHTCFNKLHTVLPVLYMYDVFSKLHRLAYRCILNVVNNTGSLPSKTDERTLGSWIAHLNPSTLGDVLNYG